MSLSGLTQVAGIARIKENYPKAIEYFQRVLSLQEDNGEVWSALGHCYLMQDDLQKAYSAYQQALYLLPNPKEDPKLWYGIGILYDRYGSLDHAEEAFSSVLRMDKDFDKANEILFRLGIIYKQQGKYQDSLDCFDRILRNPPSPLAHADIWFQIGHVFEQQKDYHRAKDAYERVVIDNPSHAKVLQQLGWLYHQDGSSFQNQDLAIQYLTKSLEADPSDAQSWYLLGRAYMAGQKYNKAYEAYQQAVYRDGRNPTFWCSIGVLYFQINQYRDALDAYSRAIRINPYISEVWFDLGSLYESCNNQITDAIDAYARASELDPSNPAITQRLQLLRQAQANGTQLPAAPGPQDVHPTAYASAVVPPPGLNGPLVTGPLRHPHRSDSRGPDSGISLPPPAMVASGRASPPFRGGPPPPVVIDDRHAPTHPQLAPMEVERPPHSRDFPPRGPSGHQNILHGHGPSQPPQMEDVRNGAPPHHNDPFYPRRAAPRSRSPSPPHSGRPRSPGHQNFSGYPPQRQHVGPAQPSGAPMQRSPRAYAADPGRPVDREAAWEHDRRPPPGAESREWDRERRTRQGGEFGQYPPMQQQRPGTPPTVVSPRQNARYQWEQKGPALPPHPSAHPHGASPPPPPPPDHRRYDREYPGEPPRNYPPSPGSHRNAIRQSHPHMAEPGRRSESPHASQGLDKDRRRRTTRDSRDFDMQGQQPGPPPPQSHPHLPPHPSAAPQISTPLADPASRKERKKRNAPRRGEGSETPKPEQQRTGSFKVASYPDNGPPSASTFRPMQPPYEGEGDRNLKLMQPPYGGMKGPSSPEAERGYGRGYGFKSASSPEPLSNGPPSARSVQPSPTIPTPRPPVRAIDEDYDGVDALMGLSQRGQPPPPSVTPSSDRPAHSPTISPGGRSDPSPRPPVSHRNSVSSTRSQLSPSSQASQLKRPRSPGSDESDSKRTRTETLRRRSSASLGRTPVPSTRPSPIPFRTQPASLPPNAHPSEPRQSQHEYGSATSPPPQPQSLVAVPALPPHPRPVGPGHASSSQQLNLPPITTLSTSSPSSTVPSPAAGDRDRELMRDDRMQVDSGASLSARSNGSGGHRSASPQVKSGQRSSRTPPGMKNTPSPGVEKKEQM
ncbi:TPR-containing protein Mql1 [Coprinopsis sp. MPI-PUGE-AT-0042]|nr:TPR-containing protein Mql1 [Coprinopsis sp. MPI-PUGE-AT-0042]